MKAEGRRRKLRSWAWLVAIGLGCQSSYAGRSEGQAAKAILVAPAAQVTALSYERPGTSTVGLFETANSSGHRSNNDRVNEAGPTHAHKPMTLFHFKSQFGDVAVQPIMGQVNGAQFSLGF
jgi:hypothetical protein